MRNQRHSLLAGIAAVAFVAGTTVAFAQEPSKDHSGTPKAKEPQAASTQPMNKPGAGAAGKEQPNGRMGEGPGGTPGKQQNAKDTERMEPSSAQQHANPNMKERMQGAQEINREQKANKGSASETNKPDAENRANLRERKEEGAPGQRQQGTVSATEDRRLKGLQGNASGTNVTLSQEQRTQIREQIINGRHAPRVGHVAFDVNVGTVIPRGRIHIVPVPRTLVEIDPAWRGFLYFVYEDEIVIVNPHDMRIVAVLPV